tara:strand:+ start:261 stop:548 length:288 start_codon:yes stop_codon:yes gene_type:complete
MKLDLAQRIFMSWLKKPHPKPTLCNAPRAALTYPEMFNSPSLSHLHQPCNCKGECRYPGIPPANSPQFISQENLNEKKYEIIYEKPLIDNLLAAA